MLMNDFMLISDELGAAFSLQNKREYIIYKKNVQKRPKKVYFKSCDIELYLRLIFYFISKL